VLHDHDAIYSSIVDRTLSAMELRVLKTPGRRAAGERLLRPP
jgi:hypothetical protein